MNKSKKIITIGLVAIFLLTIISALSANASYINLNSYEVPFLKIDDVENNPNGLTNIDKSGETKRNSVINFDLILENIGGDDLYLHSGSLDGLDINKDWASDPSVDISYSFDDDWPLSPGEEMTMQLECRIYNNLFQSKTKEFEISLNNKAIYNAHYAPVDYNWYIIKFTIDVDGAIESEIMNSEAFSLRNMLANRFPVIFNLFSNMKVF